MNRLKRREKKQQINFRPGNPLFIRALADAQRIGNANIIRQVVAAKGADRKKLIRLVNIIGAILAGDLEVDKDSVVL